GVNLGMVQTLVAALRETSIDEEFHAIQASLIKAGSHLPRADIIKLAEVKLAEKNRRRVQIIKVLSMIEVVIGEEAHEAGGNSYYEILRHCKSATIRVALTATPFMRDGAEDNMRLMAAFGPVLIKISEKLLIDRGILAKPYFKFHETKPHARLHRTSPW